MALYCYIVETGYYEDVTANILGHENKYSSEEFHDLCIEITEKHGDVEEIEYFSSYDKTDVTEIRYNIDGNELIKHLVNEYGFIKLDIPVNDGYNRKEISREPVPEENLRKVVTKSAPCPWQEGNSEKDSNINLFENQELTCPHPDSDFEGIRPKHINARCKLDIIRKDEKND